MLSCIQLTVCDLRNCRPPDSFVPGVFRARILERVAISYSRAPSCRRDQPCVSDVSCPGRWTLYHLHRLGSLSLCRMPQTKLRRHFLFRNDGTIPSALYHSLAVPPKIKCTWQALLGSWCVISISLAGAVEIPGGVYVIACRAWHKVLSKSSRSNLEVLLILQRFSNAKALLPLPLDLRFLSQACL